MNYAVDERAVSVPLISLEYMCIPPSLTGQALRVPSYQLIRIVGGEGLLVIDERRFDIIPGRIFLVTPWQVLEYSKVDAIEVVHTEFSADMLSKLYGDILIERIKMYSPEHAVQYVDIRESNHEKVDTLQALLKQELIDDSSHQSTKRAIFCAYLCVISEMVGGGKPRNQDAFRVETLMALISDNYAVDHSVEFYADKMNLSCKQLNRIAKDNTGYTVSQLIQNHLILEAKRRIISGSYGVKSIAITLGFTDPSYFSRFFRRHVGKSPREYRSQALGKKI